MANILENRKARFDYTIEDTFEAGIELSGSEVKSLRAGRGNISGSHVKILSGEAYILGMKIEDYQGANILGKQDKERTRKLLLHKNELKKLHHKIDEKGLTLVPLSLYLKKRWVKLSIGLGKGRKKSDKREVLKKRAVERDIRREYSVR